MVNVFTFDLAEFSPLPAILGGLCLGFFSSSKLYLTGRPLGISSILRSALQKKRKETSMLDWGVNICFMMGFVAAAIVGGVFHPHLLQPFPEEPTATPKWGGNAFFFIRILFGGFITGAGTTWSSGCTSGHGITGISRFSIRSLAATCCFMFSAIVCGTAMNVSRDFPKPGEGVALASPAESGSAYVTLAIAVVFLAAVSSPTLLGAGDSYRVRAVRVYAIEFISALGFACGLTIGGMAMPGKMAGFLDLRNWDPTLPFIMLGAHLIQTPIMQLVIEPLMMHSSRPPVIGLLDSEGNYKDCSVGQCGWSIKGVNKNLIDRKLVVGALTFGVGWALSATCPGPSLLMLGAYTDRWPSAHNLGLAVGWLIAFIAGTYAAQSIPLKAAVAPAGAETKEQELDSAVSVAVAEVPVEGAPVIEDSATKPTEAAPAVGVTAEGVAQTDLDGMTNSAETAYAQSRPEDLA